MNENIDHEAEERLREWARNNYTPGIFDDQVTRFGFHKVIIEEWRLIEEQQDVIKELIETYNLFTDNINKLLRFLPNRKLQDLLEVSDKDVVIWLNQCRSSLNQVNDDLRKIIERFSTDLGSEKFTPRHFERPSGSRNSLDNADEK